MYESVDSSVPLYSMPHLSLTTTSWFTSSARNGFGFTGCIACEQTKTHSTNAHPWTVSGARALPTTPLLSSGALQHMRTLKPRERSPRHPHVLRASPRSLRVDGLGTTAAVRAHIHSTLGARDWRAPAAKARLGCASRRQRGPGSLRDSARSAHSGGEVPPDTDPPAGMPSVTHHCPHCTPSLPCH